MSFTNYRFWSFFLLLISISEASDFKNWDSHSGKGAFAFLSTFQGARSQALSGATGSAQNPDLFNHLVNPAAMERTGTKHQIGLAYETGSIGANLGLLTYQTPYRKYNLQTTVAWRSYGSIDGTDTEGDLTGKTYEPFSQAFMLSTSFPMSYLSFGATLKLIRDHLSDDSQYKDQDAIGTGLDWGFVWRSPYPLFGFGFSVLDLGKQWTAYTESGLNHQALNTRLRASGHYRPALFRGMTVSLDAVIPRYSQPTLNVGIEYIPKPWIHIRFGMERPMADLRGDGSQLPFASAGLGFMWKQHTLDYAVQILQNGLGQKHWIGLRTGF